MDISHKAMLQSQALRENKIIIQHIAKSYNASTTASTTCICNLFYESL